MESRVGPWLVRARWGDFEIEADTPYERLLAVGRPPHRGGDRQTVGFCEPQPLQPGLPHGLWHVSPRVAGRAGEPVARSWSRPWPGESVVEPGDGGALVGRQRGAAVEEGSAEAGQEDRFVGLLQLVSATARVAPHSRVAGDGRV